MSDPEIPELPRDSGEMVKVYETAECDVLPVIKSILDSTDIPYNTDGESMMNTFPSEAMSGGLLGDTGEVRIYVPADRAEEATAMLSESFQLAEDTPELSDTVPYDDETKA